MEKTSFTKELIYKRRKLRKFTLEQALDYIAEDELVEVTPTNIRLRKKILKEGDRRKNWSVTNK